MNPNVFGPSQALSDDKIHEILIKRIDQEKQATGIVTGVVDPNGRRVIAHGNPTNGGPRPVDGTVRGRRNARGREFLARIVSPGALLNGGD